MKKMFLILLATVEIVSSCSKNKDVQCTSVPPATVAPAAEITYLQNYITANNITAVQQPNGVFYTLSTQGTGKSPNVCSSVTVKYQGYVLGNGTAFDSTPSGQTTSFTLDGLIAGWQLVLPLVKAGGTVTLYIPPSLGYGARVSGSIPANSYLKFNIDLVDVN